MSRGTHIAVRTCMGCGARAPQRELLRIAATPDGALTVPQRQTHAGRTGYLHKHPECWTRFAARKGPVRSLARSVDKTVRAALVQALERTQPSAMMR